jgi:transcriptional regulator with XRE-family HTH domain
VTPARTTRSRKGFDELCKQIDADPTRRANLDEHKSVMLSELRRKLDLTQAIVADRLDVTQENVSQIERGEADVRLSTLSRYVEALGGRLEIRAAFPEETIALSMGDAATMRRRRTRADSAATKTPRNRRTTPAGNTTAASDA